MVRACWKLTIRMSKEKLIFVSDLDHIAAEIPGGVQLCSAEYISLFQAAGYDVEHFSVSHTTSLLVRAKIKLGFDIYERYDFKRLFPLLLKKINNLGIRYVALNQVALVGFAPLLKKTFGSEIKIIVLSHGNESGDFLHEIIRTCGPVNRVRRIRDIYRLGAMIYTESRAYTEVVDLLLSISETELQVNNWLGAKRSLFIPRIFKPEDIGRKPYPNRVGFVGSLNHKPNYDGILAVIEEMEGLGDNNVIFRIVGGPADIGRSLQERYSSVQYVGHLSDPEFRLEASTWALFLNPIFWYSRGASTKLAIGINWGIPVISTPPGNRGYRWEKGKITTVNSPFEMAETIVSITNDVHKIQALSEDVVRVASSGPDIEKLAQRLNELL